MPDPATGDFVVLGGLQAGRPVPDQWRLDDPSVPFWRRIRTAAVPRRLDAATAFDAATGQVVMFGGGAEGTGATNETWVYQDGTWQRVTPAASPPAMFSASLAYDPASRQLILFGGLNSSFTYFDQTWAWTGDTWRKLSPATSPPARSGAMMAYDPERGRLILYGGIAFGIGPADATTTWQWTGSTWQVLPSLLNPGPRASAGLAYDPVKHELVLFGGGIPDHGATDATWTLGNYGWLPAFPADKPRPETPVSMTTDGADQAIMVFDGVDSATSSRLVFAGDTWLYNGQNWRLVPQLYSPSPRGGALLAPLGGDRVLLAGGFTESQQLTDTWIYGRAAPATPVQLGG